MQPMLLKCLAAALCALPGALAIAQQSPPASPATAPATPPARGIPRPDDLEPGVNTSAPAATAPSATPAAAAPSPDATSTAPAAASAPRKGSAPSAAVAAAAPATSADRKGAPVAKASAGKGADRIELDTTDITGNRELPKVLYIVPWKRSDLGDLVGRPANSLLDEVLAPVDRDVFKRENRYYDALTPDAAGTPAGGPLAPSSAPGAAAGSGGKP